MPNVAVAQDTGTWAIDANTLTANNIQEDGWFSDGDEPYVGVVKFRSKFGVAGSTSTSFLGGLKELSSGADDGDSMTISNAMGRATFTNVTRCNGLSAWAGTCQVEIVGTLTVAMESDSTPWSVMNSGFSEAAKVAKREIASVIETTPLNQIGTKEFQDRLAAATDRIRNRAKLTFWESLGNWIVSASDPDDRIAARITIFAAVDSSIASLVENGINSKLTADQGVGGALNPRTFNMGFSGDGARYTVAYRVSGPS